MVGCSIHWRCNPPCAWRDTVRPSGCTRGTCSCMELAHSVNETYPVTPVGREQVGSCKEGAVASRAAKVLGGKDCAVVGANHPRWAGVRGMLFEYSAVLV